MKATIDQEKGDGSDSDFDAVAGTLARFPKLYFSDPYKLDVPPEKVVEDID